MSYRTLSACIADLERHGQLVRIEEEVDANLEAAEIHRRVFAAGGPAVLFTNVTDCSFPMVSNLFGTMGRTRFIFRSTLDQVRRLIQLKIDPTEALRQPFASVRSAGHALRMLPRHVRSGPVLINQTTIDQLPQLKSWPQDGGAFVTLPIVYTEDPHQPGTAKSNLGMYRIQLSGNEYQANEEIGLHYQLHRGIGIHHTRAVAKGQPFRVNIFVGGTPAMSVAAVMPLPEGLAELRFAGALAGHRIPMIRGTPAVYAEADFCITGVVDPDRLLPEGPFGDHLGYYSLTHDFPVLRIERVSHRPGAIWPFTVVGRPPQEDTMFGKLIHELTGPVVPTVVPGVKEVHAVDAAGVHPLMLAIGSERYVPYQATTQPQEILTQANAILGHGQMSLAKYLLIVAQDDQQRTPATRDVEAFLGYLLRRINWKRDLHFHTCTTIDTLDYSGSALNQGSKVVLAAAGPPVRELPVDLPSEIEMPPGFRSPRVCLPGVVAIQGPRIVAGTDSERTLTEFCRAWQVNSPLCEFPLWVLVDDSDFVSRSLNNFLWVTFTRSNPARDIEGVESFIHDKHWGCRGSLVIDARSKPHHAPGLVSDPAIVNRVDALAARGKPISKWL